MTHVRGRVWRAGKPQDDFDFPSISDYLVEDDLFENNPRSGLQRRTFRLRKDLVELRRVVLPMREAVPTAITGFYGQNVLYPGINTLGGFVTSTAVIVVIVITLYRMFRQRDWL